MARFEVRSSTLIHVNPSFEKDGANWGLWDWDVVELFVSCAPKGLPYYEFQVSPLGQRFELKIEEPRKKVDRDFKSGFMADASKRPRSPGGWDAEISVPLSVLGWDRKPESIIGNAFAILGPPKARTYWSRFLKPQKVPDFHRPKEFKSLIKGR